MSQVRRPPLLIAGLLMSSFVMLGAGMAGQAQADDRSRRNAPRGAELGGTPAEQRRVASTDEEEVTCFAGCVGKPGEVLSRRKRPAEPATPRSDNQSYWRRMGHNLWCHDVYGCRSYNVIPPRRYCHRSQRSTHITMTVYHMRPDY